LTWWSYWSQTPVSFPAKLQNLNHKLYLMNDTYQFCKSYQDHASKPESVKYAWEMKNLNVHRKSCPQFF
jgi:hypothetical protein